MYAGAMWAMFSVISEPTGSDELPIRSSSICSNQLWSVKFVKSYKNVQVTEKCTCADELEFLLVLLIIGTVGLPLHISPGGGEVWIVNWEMP
jgi:hypothetical protein